MDIILLVIGIVAIVFGCLYYMDRKHDREVIDIVVEFLENYDDIKVDSYRFGYAIKGWYNSRRYVITWYPEYMTIWISYKYKEKIKDSLKNPKNKYEFEIYDKGRCKKIVNLIRLYRDRENYMGDEIIQDDVEIEKLRYTGENANEQLIKDIIKELK